MNSKLSKYGDDTSKELLLHLKRTLRTYEVNFDWLEDPIKFVVVGDKSHTLEDNKKYLVNLINQYVGDEWSHLGERMTRRTIKKFLDGIS